MNKSTTKTPSIAEVPSVNISVNRLTSDRPKAWLIAGMQDFRAAKAVSLSYGLFWVALSIAITVATVALGYWHLLLPMVAGFMLLGPLVAVGAYGISQAIEQGRTPNLGDAFSSWKPYAGQLAMIGVMMLISFLAWIRLTTLLLALFFGLEVLSPQAVYTSLVTTPEGLGMLAIGTVAGAVMALGTFAISVVAIPTIMDHDLTFMEGIEASIRCVSGNFRTMLIWAAMLTGCVLVGIATFYLGFALILPVLGHASWHAYKELVVIKPVEKEAN
ncbi:DUF2189 domain-containing protein [Halovibrio sp. HP20-50]|uniref:DUF2189 domain-containing protein n=1 Tax=Halovibrio sp. HP20-59 TaxID=3080275 RepID=UPI00294B9095|nr:DUF2189 domain-containing protein [Halovibrio sp. HP20-59]MEA2117416.1 DUF2189 domain-containing protein [Halovibrio sp. HP20-59]